jgi:nicotinamide-nucleotide amidase
MSEAADKTQPDDLPDDAGRLADFAREVLARVDQAGLKIATAESCTGGLVASLCTDIEGLGSTFERGFVTYSEEAKCELLGIEPELIERYGVVSSEVAEAMAAGALSHSRAGLVVAITGFAGKAGKDDEAGLVYLAARRRDGGGNLREAHYGEIGRDRVRMLAARAALEMIGELLLETVQAASR